MPKHATTDQEIERCFNVMKELRTHLEGQDFVATIRAMEKDGYKLAFIENGENVVAVAGYRIHSNLFMGKNLYVDDLVTSEKYRSKGYGEELVRWLRELAINSGCNFYHLDSGTHRHEAHKFYFRQGFSIASYHFSEELTDQS